MSGGLLFDPATIRALAEILRDTELTEIELVDKESRIRLARQLPAPVIAPAAEAHDCIALFSRIE